MLHYDRIDVFEGIGINKISASKNVIFVIIGIFKIKFQPYFCNGCHYVLIMFIKLNDIALLDVNGADYRCTINGISKSDVANSGENADLTKKKAILSK